MKVKHNNNAHQQQTQSQLTGESMRLNFNNILKTMQNPIKVILYAKYI